MLVENFPVPIQRIGIKDVLNEAGINEELLSKFCMSHEHMIEAVKNMISRKKL